MNPIESLVGGLEHFLFFHILEIIIPTDFHGFQRGRSTTNQLLNSMKTPRVDDQKHDITIPIGSMYAICGNIYYQYTPNVSIYTSTMDPLGYVT